MSGSSPWALCTTAWRRPISDSSEATIPIVATMAIRPKASGASSRVMIKLLANLSTSVQP
jgi:hypothetical protein